MSKAEKFISDCTRNCSNEMSSPLYANPKLNFYPWLTPDQARKAVEIAREEMIEKFYDWLKSNATYIHPRKGTEECITTLVKLKQAMKDE
jgi:hypothetical protein